ncbi:MAG: phosphonate ABC transporter ATP-binding protein [Hydrogenophaga sp.]|uniref:phosphonate ABC transporter ATP-binding protein n=1 Tax=Hydrogenophaga sp. TaxID=1904254 RepID=UPI00262D957C|nr:phosphonate ABC transporter ATP-binding protein [Hydrogenophaga sp.]MDM7942223.1 phosphonate ABC transporter ATP-binding protein [Hydrogenophaga sp.]
MVLHDAQVVGFMPQGSGASAAPDGSPPPGGVWPDLVVRGVGKAFSPGAPVLADICFSVPAGQSVALIGSNGAGKSTLLRCCMHLIAPDQGSVQLFGQSLQAQTASGLRGLRAQVGFVFQKHNLVPRLSALSNVLHGALTRTPPGRAWFQGTAPRHLRDEAMHCLERVGLADHALKRADHLSGGQSQRVAVARALMQRPRFLVADEPAASLDPVSGDEVMGLFASLVKRDGLTLLFTSHDLSHALRYADRVIALNRGRIVKDTPSARTDATALRSLYDIANPAADTRLAATL